MLGYLELGFASMLQIKSFNSENANFLASSLIGIFYLLLAALLPFLVIIKFRTGNFN